MAEGIGTYWANKFLDAGGRNVSFAGTAVYVKLHTGAPGASGTNNAATETTRKSATFSAAAGGSIVTSADLTWTNISGSQTVTKFTAWDDLTAGQFLFSGSITANAYTAGDTFTITSGNLSANFTLAT